MQMKKLLEYQELNSKKGITWSKPHLWRKERAGEFPRRLYVGARTPAWDEDEIDAWIEERKVERHRRAA
jgi:prophage regulatory protein